MFFQNSDTQKKQKNTYRKNFLLSITGFVIFVWALFAVSSEASDSSVNLMRLNLSQTGGTVKVEITGDRPITNFRIKKSDNKFVVQIKGARSMLQPAYQVRGSFVDEVQVLAKESDGESGVELVINTQQDAAAVSVIEFNTLSILVESRAAFKANESFSIVAKDNSVSGSQPLVQYKDNATTSSSNGSHVSKNSTPANEVKK
jgi:hypothetical protein